MKLYLAIILFLGIVYFQSAEARFDCWSCNSRNLTGQVKTNCETGKNMNTGWKEKNCDMCTKTHTRTDRRQVFEVTRGCLTKRDYPGGNDLFPRTGCYRMDLEKGRTYYCMCNRANCNSATYSLLNKPLGILCAAITFFSKLQI